MGEWECMECGYKAPGQERPARCPECDAPTEAFEYFEYEEDDYQDFDDLEDDGAGYAEEEDDMVAAGDR